MADATADFRKSMVGRVPYAHGSAVRVLPIEDERDSRGRIGKEMGTFSNCNACAWLYRESKMRKWPPASWLLL